MMSSSRARLRLPPPYKGGIAHECVSLSQASLPFGVAGRSRTAAAASRRAWARCSLVSSLESLGIKGIHILLERERKRVCLVIELALVTDGGKDELRIRSDLVILRLGLAKGKVSW